MSSSKKIDLVHLGTFKRQATRRDWLPSLLGVGDKWSKIVCGESNSFCTRLTAAQAGQKSLLYWHEEPKQPMWAEPPFICAPFVPIYLSYNRGHPFLVSVAITSRHCVLFSRPSSFKQLLSQKMSLLRWSIGGFALGYKCFCCTKKFSDFPVPSRDVTNQTLPGQE